MNLKRTTTMVVVGAALVAWLAGAADLESHDSATCRSCQQTADRKARRGARRRDRAAARASRARRWRRARRAAICSRSTPPPRPVRAAAAAAPRPALTELAAAADRAAAAEAVGHRRRSRRRRPGAHRDHLRRGTAVHGQGRRDGHAALPRREDLRRRRRAHRPHRQQCPKACASVSLRTRAETENSELQLSSQFSASDPCRPPSSSIRSPAARARGRRARARSWRSAVVDAHGDPVEVLLTEARRPRARAGAGRRCARGARLVLAWGGDGTINEVASALAFGDVPLGIVPGRIGQRPGARARRASAGRSARSPTRCRRCRGRWIVGEIDGRLFVEHRRHRLRRARRRGSSRPRRAAASSATPASPRARSPTYAPQHYRVTIGGVETAHRAILVTIANSAQFGNGARIAPGARVDDGELDLVVVEERSRFGDAAAACRGCSTAPSSACRGCSIRRIREVTIESDQPMTFHVDGEPVAGRDQRCGCGFIPARLRVAVR